MPQSLLFPRHFGKSSIIVPAIALGCAPLGNMPETFGHTVSEDDALATVHATLRSEMPYLDTAASYNDGESERRVGLVLRELGRLPAHATLQTKIGADADGVFTGEVVERRLERSLKLLGTDRLEIVYLHDPEDTTFEEAMAPNGPVAVLQRYKEQGVIGQLGVAGGPIDLEIRYVETGMFDTVITHNRYTLLNRVAEPLLEMASSRGMAILNAAPYASGLLAKGPDAYPRYVYADADEETLNRARQLAAICDDFNVPLGAVALQFSLRDPRITATIVGMSHPQRVEQTVEWARMEIASDIWNELEAVPFAMEELA